MFRRILRKVIKISLTVLSVIILSVIILPVLAALLLNVESVQNFAVRKAGSIITETLGTQVSMERIKIRGFSKLEAKGFYVQDLAGDTLIYAGTLTGNISKTALTRRKLIIGDITLEDGRIYLHKPENGDMNIQEVLDTFLDRDRERKGRTDILLRDIYISGTRFKLQIDGRDSIASDRMNFGNLIFDGLTVGSHNLAIKGQRISMNLYGMSFTDVSGFKVDLLETEEFVIDQGLLDFTNTSIKTPDSYLTLPDIKLDGYGNWKRFSSFTDSVRMDVALNNSDVHSRTLSYIIPGIPRQADIMLNGADLTFTGTVNDFNGELKNIVTGGTRLHGTYAVKGVTDIKKAWFDLDIPSLSTDAFSLENLAYEFLSQEPDTAIINMLHRAGNMEMALKAVGEMNNFDADLNLSSPLGGIAAKAEISSAVNNGIKFDGTVEVEGFELGRLLATNTLGEIYVNGKLRGTVSNGKIDAQGNVGVPLIRFNDNIYRNIWISAAYEDKSVNGRIVSLDPGLRLSMAGKANLRDSLPEYDLTLNVKNADLNKLGFNKRDSISVITGDIIAQASGTNPDNLNGTISLENIVYTSSSDSVATGSMLITGRNNPQYKFLSLESEFADARFISRLSYLEVFDYLRHVIYDYIPALATGDTHHAYHRDVDEENRMSRSGTSRFKLNVKKANNVAAIFVPGFSIAEGTNIDFLFNPSTETMTLKAESEFLEYGKFLVTELAVNADNTTAPDTLNIYFQSKDLYFPGYSAPSSSVHAKASADRLGVTARISDQETDINATFDINAWFGRRLDGSLEVNGKFAPSYISTANQTWRIFDEGVTYDPEGIYINNFRIVNGTQELYAGGAISNSRSDTLRIELKELDAALFSPLLAKTGYSISGELNGYADISSVMKQPLLSADISLERLKINSYSIEAIDMRSQWDFGRERARVVLTGRNTGKEYVNGYYRPSDNAYMADVDIPSLQLSVLEPLLKGSVTNTSGSLALKAEVRSGNNNAPVVTGTVDIKDMAATAAATKVHYTLSSGRIKIDKNRAVLDQTTILDQENNRATLNASADLRNFSNISYSARLIPDNMLALNTGSRDNELFYGKVYTSGTIDLKGDRLGLYIDAVATTDDNSHLTMPLGGKSSVSQADFIIFESASELKEEDMDILTRKKLMYERSRIAANARRLNMNLNVTLNVLPNTLVSLVLDSESNNILNAQGTSSLNMYVNPSSNEFTMNGTYEIAEGDFMFSIPGLINNRKFTLQPGGTIQWTGEPIDALLNISAVYRLRATVPESMKKDLSNISSRIPIECSINITDRLSQPNISFSVNAPNADLETQNQINSIFATQERLATEFVWLVAFNSFYPEDIGESQNFQIGSTTTAIGWEFLTSNISNILSSISDVADFTLRVRPQDEFSSSEVDIGFTTDIIPNRLLLEVEGNFDTGDNPQAITNNNISGDAALTAIINKPGTVRSKLFTRTIDRLYDDRQGMQEHGLGIYYREDFDKFADVIKRRRARSEKKEREKQIKASEGEALKPEEITEEPDRESQERYDYE